MTGNALHESMDRETASRVSRFLLYPTLTKIEKGADEKLSELLKPHAEGHPITYNQHMARNIQRAQNNRKRKRTEQILDSHFPHHASWSSASLTKETLLSALSAVDDDADMAKHAAVSAIDTMEAYYKVALEKFIDDVSVLAIENCVMKQLPTILSPNAIFDLSETTVTKLAGESDESTAKRGNLQNKLNTLQKGLHKLAELNAAV